MAKCECNEICANAVHFFFVCYLISPHYLRTSFHSRAPGFQSRSQSPTSGQANSAEAAVNKPMDFPAVKRTKIPFLSSPDQVSQENLDPAQEIER